MFVVVVLIVWTVAFIRFDVSILEYSIKSEVFQMYDIIATVFNKTVLFRFEFVYVEWVRVVL